MLAVKILLKIPFVSKSKCITIINISAVIIILIIPIIAVNIIKDLNHRKKVTL